MHINIKWLGNAALWGGEGGEVGAIKSVDDTGLSFICFVLVIVMSCKVIKPIYL